MANVCVYTVDRTPDILISESVRQIFLGHKFLCAFVY